MTSTSKGHQAPDGGLPSTFIVDPHLLNLPEGLRSGLAIASVVLLAEWLRLPVLIWPALAAWLACLVDPGGPLRVRLRAQLLFGVIGAVITAGFGLLPALLPMPLLAALGAAAIFALALLRALGPGGIQLGVLLSVVLVLALRVPLPGPRAAGIAGMMFIAGAVWAATLTALLWRLHPFQTSRGAVAGSWHALGRLNADLLGMVQAAPGGGSAAWLHHARAYRREVRQSLEEARGRILAHAAELRGAAWRLDPAWQGLEAAEQVFDALVALGDLAEQDDAAATRATAEHLLGALTPVLDRTARAIEAGLPVRPPPRGALLSLAAEAQDCPALQAIVARLVDGLDAAATIAAEGEPAWRAAAAAPPGAWRSIRAQCHRDAPLLRHALRLAVASAAGLVLMLALPADHGHWLTIALLVTLQPDVATTLARAAERIGGTLAGATLGAGIALLLPSAMMMTLAVFVLSVATAALRRVSFGAFVAGVSAVVVVLLEVDHPGDTEALRVALQRALYTLAGGALALGCAVLLWPDWAGARLEGALRATLVAHLRYAALAVAQMRGEAGEAALLEARRAVGQTSADAEDLLQRTLLEHGRSATAGLGAALGTDAALRRAGGRIASLRLGMTLSDAAAATEWQAWFEATAAATIAGDSWPPCPGGGAEPTLAGIGRQLNEAAEGLARLRAAGGTG